MVQSAGESGEFVDKTHLLSAPFIGVANSNWSVQRFGPFTAQDIPVANHYLVNTEDVFHLGIVNGGANSGCFYGYFSDYNDFNPTTLVIETGTPGARVCVGETLQLYASGGTQYLWTPDTYLDDPSSPTPIASNILESILYSVEISGACNLAAVETVAIQAAGPVDAQFEPDVFNGCARPPVGGGTPAYNFTFTSTSTGDYSREWRYRLGPTGPITTFAAGNNDSADPAGVVTLSLPNNTDQSLDYYITLICGSNPPFCFGDVTHIVSVLPSPSVSPTASPTEGCSPLEVNFNANPSGYFNNAVYYWDFDDGSSTFMENPNHNFINNSGDIISYNVSLFAINEWECNDTSDITIAVYPQVIADFAVDIDEGLSPLVVHIFNTSIAADLYHFDMGDGTEYTTAHPFHTFYNYSDETIEYTITLTASSEYDCSDTFLRTITVHPAPLYQLTLAVNPIEAGTTSEGGSFYADEVVTIEAFPSYGYEFENWTIDDEVISSLPIHNFTMPEQDVTITANFKLITYSLTFLITDVLDNAIDNAIVSLNGTTYEAGNYVFTNLLPNVYTYIVTSSCSPAVTGEITILDSDLNEYVTLDLLFGDANGDGVVNFSDLHSMALYIVGIQPEQFCFYNADVITDGVINILDIIATANIIIYDQKRIVPKLISENSTIFLNNNGIIFSGDGTVTGLQFELINVQEEIDLSVALPSHQVVSYQHEGTLIGVVYSNENIPIPAGNTLVLNFDNLINLPDWGNVVAANINAETAPVDEEIGDPTAINTNQYLDKINLYPNPANNQLYIELPFTSPFPVSYKVINVHGQVLIKSTESVNSTPNLRVDLNSINPGVYFLILEHNGKTLNRKFIKL